MATQVVTEGNPGVKLRFCIRKYLVPKRDKMGRPLLNKYGKEEKQMRIVRTMYLYYPKELGNSSGFWKINRMVRDGVDLYSLSTIPRISEKLEWGNRYQASGTPMVKHSVPNSYNYTVAVPVDMETVTYEELKTDAEGKVVFKEVTRKLLTNENNEIIGRTEEIVGAVAEVEYLSYERAVTERETVEDASWFSGEKPTWEELNKWIDSRQSGDTGGFKKVEPYMKSVKRKEFTRFLSSRLESEQLAEECLELLEKLPPEKFANEK